MAKREKQFEQLGYNEIEIELLGDIARTNRDRPEFDTVEKGLFRFKKGLADGSFSPGLLDHNLFQSGSSEQERLIEQSAAGLDGHKQKHDGEHIILYGKDKGQVLKNGKWISKADVKYYVALPNECITATVLCLGNEVVFAENRALGHIERDGKETDAEYKKRVLTRWKKDIHQSYLDTNQTLANSDGDVTTLTDQAYQLHRRDESLEKLKESKTPETRTRPSTEVPLVILHGNSGKFPGCMYWACADMHEARFKVHADFNSDMSRTSNFEQAANEAFDLGYIIEDFSLNGATSKVRLFGAQTQKTGAPDNARKDGKMGMVKLDVFLNELREKQNLDETEKNLLGMNPDSDEFRHGIIQWQKQKHASLISKKGYSACVVEDLASWKALSKYKVYVEATGDEKVTQEVFNALIIDEIGEGKSEQFKTQYADVIQAINDKRGNHEITIKLDSVPQSAMDHVPVIDMNNDKKTGTITVNQIESPAKRSLNKQSVKEVRHEQFLKKIGMYLSQIERLEETNREVALEALLLSLDEFIPESLRSDLITEYKSDHSGFAKTIYPTIDEYWMKEGLDAATDENFEAALCKITDITLPKDNKGKVVAKSYDIDKIIADYKGDQPMNAQQLLQGIRNSDHLVDLDMEAGETLRNNPKFKAQMKFMFNFKEGWVTSDKHLQALQDESLKNPHIFKDKAGESTMTVFLDENQQPTHVEMLQLNGEKKVDVTYHKLCQDGDDKQLLVDCYREFKAANKDGDFHKWLIDSADLDSNQGNAYKLLTLYQRKISSEDLLSEVVRLKGTKKGNPVAVGFFSACSEIATSRGCGKVLDDGNNFAEAPPCDGQDNNSCQARNSILQIVYILAEWKKEGGSIEAGTKINLNLIEWNDSPGVEQIRDYFNQPFADDCPLINLMSDDDNLRLAAIQTLMGKFNLGDVYNTANPKDQAFDQELLTKSGKAIAEAQQYLSSVREITALTKAQQYLAQNTNLLHSGLSADEMVKYSKESDSNHALNNLVGQSFNRDLTKKERHDARDMIIAILENKTSPYWKTASETIANSWNMHQQGRKQTWKQILYQITSSLGLSVVKSRRGQIHELTQVSDNFKAADAASSETADTENPTQPDQRSPESPRNDDPRGHRGSSC